MTESSFVVRPGEIAALLQLAALDARIQLAERMEMETARLLKQHSVGLESLSRFLEDDRGRLKTASAENVSGLYSSMEARQREIASLAGLFEADRLRAAPALERARATHQAARAERDSLLRELSRALVERYEALIARGTIAFIVPIRDGRCTGCAFRLTPEVVTTMKKPDTMSACPRCQRMLYGRGLDA